MIPTSNCGAVFQMKLLSEIQPHSATMTSNQNTFMFLKAGLYDGTSDDLYIEIVRYYQAIDKPFFKKKSDIQTGIILFTCKDIMCPFQVKARRQSHTAIWNLTQDSLNLAHMYGLTFGDRNAPKHPVLSMIYPQIGLCIAVTSKTGGCTKCIQ